MNSHNITKSDNPAELLKWYIDIGVDEALSETPRHWHETSDKKAADKTSPAAEATKPETKTRPVQAPTFTPDDEALLSAREIAAACTTLQQLEDALSSFDACGLKKTAQNLVLYDGLADARTLFIGEAPGADEDRLGKPFVGRSGKLLDKMLASIGLSRSAEDFERSVCISNVIFWRPPGNRKPTDIEASLCLPFAEKLIDIVAPEVIVCLGATPMHRLVGGHEGILRARGKWQNYETKNGPIPLLPTLHPAYLLRNPAQKKHSWKDFLSLREKLDSA